MTAADRPAVQMAVPGRVTWTLRLPHGGRLRTSVATQGSSPVRFRVGVSDDRTYEGLASAVVSASEGWVPLNVDLSAYAGWKWSLFYRPDRIAWQLTFSTDALGPGDARALWSRPEILTTHDGALEYARRIGRPQR